MPHRTRQSQLTPQQPLFHGITVGTVVDTNDPQQMGRVRAVCAGLGDTFETTYTAIPWASYASPFAGTTQLGTKGRGDDETTGPVAYGVWGIPKVGAQVLVMCIDGDPTMRVWVGCLPTQLANHTMPHGRFTYKDDDKIPESDTKPVGPLTGFETKIEPLASNLERAFGNGFEGNHNYEFATRAADFQLASVSSKQIPSTLSLVSDDQDFNPNIANTSEDFPLIRQGYQTDRQTPDLQVPENLGPRLLDNMVTSIVSPGFHALSMDDRKENSRIRIRTVGGHQIIMDDTNERIYISTAKGENWIEIDETGNIDIYTSGKLSAHAKEDINFTTDSTFRVYAKKGIHMRSDRQTRFTSTGDFTLRTDAVMRMQADTELFIQANDRDVNIKAGGKILQGATNNIEIKGKNINIEASTAGNFKANSNLNLQTSAVLNLNAQGALIATGSTIQLNGPPAGSASGAAEAEDAIAGNENFDAFLPLRVPNHEPWPRIDSRANDTTDPYREYTSADIGRFKAVVSSDGLSLSFEEIIRNGLWRR